VDRNIEIPLLRNAKRLQPSVNSSLFQCQYLMVVDIKLPLGSMNHFELVAPVYIHDYPPNPPWGSFEAPPWIHQAVFIQPVESDLQISPASLHHKFFNGRLIEDNFD
jgi:hypothetical protein